MAVMAGPVTVEVAIDEAGWVAIPAWSIDGEENMLEARCTEALPEALVDMHDVPCLMRVTFSSVGTRYGVRGRLSTAARTCRIAFTELPQRWPDLAVQDADP